MGAHICGSIRRVGRLEYATFQKVTFAPSFQDRWYVRLFNVFIEWWVTT